MPASTTTGPATAVQRSRSSASCAASGSTPREETRCTSAPDRAAARAAPAARATTASSASLEPAGPTTTTSAVRSRFSRSTTTGSPRRAVVRQCTAVPSPGDQARRECTSGPDRAMVTGPSSPSPTSAADCTGTGSTPGGDDALRGVRQHAGAAYQGERGDRLVVRGEPVVQPAGLRVQLDLEHPGLPRGHRVDDGVGAHEVAAARRGEPVAGGVRREVVPGHAVRPGADHELRARGQADRLHGRHHEPHVELRQPRDEPPS